MITCSTSNLNIDKGTPTNYQLIFPLVPSESSIGANNPFIMNIFSAILPSVSIAQDELRWQGNKTRRGTIPMEFDPWMVNFVVDSKIANWKLLYNWINFINNNNDKIADYHNVYSVDCSLVVTDNYRNSILEIIFVSVWPGMLGEVSFSQREGDVILESQVNFNYDYFYVRNRARNRIWPTEFSSSSSSTSSSSKSSSSSSSSSESSSSSSSSKSSSSSSSSLSSSSSSSSKSSSSSSLSSSSSSSSKSSSSSSSSLSSSSSSSSLSSSSSSSSLSSSSSESSNPDLIAGLYVEEGFYGSAHTQILNNAPLLIDNNVCDAAIPSASNRSLTTIGQAFGFGFIGSENIYGFDVVCHVSGSAIPPYDFIDPHSEYRITSWTSNNNNNWDLASFNYGSSSYPWPDAFDLLPIVRSRQETVKFRIPYTNLSDTSLPTAKYFKFLNLKSLIVSGANGELGQLIVTEIMPMEGICSVDGWSITIYPERYIITNNYRTIRSINNNVLFVQFGRWCNPPGKYYWEVVCNGVSPPRFHVGFKSGLIGNDTTDLNDFQYNGSTYTVNGSAANSYNDGDVLQFAVDIKNSKWWGGINGTWLFSGNPSIGSNPIKNNVRFGNIVAAIIIYSNNVTTFTSQFKASQMTYDIPEGFYAPVVDDYEEIQSCSSSSSSTSSSSSSRSSSSTSSSSSSSSSSESSSSSSSSSSESSSSSSSSLNSSSSSSSSSSSLSSSSSSSSKSSSSSSSSLSSSSSSSSKSSSSSSSSESSSSSLSTSGAWTPLDLSPVVWLDASDSETITLDISDKVEQWDDKSGNLRHATQTVSGERPVHTASGIGTLAVIDTSSLSYMMVTFASTVNLSVATVAVVFKTNSATSTKQVFDLRKNNGTDLIDDLGAAGFAARARNSSSTLRSTTAFTKDTNPHIGIYKKSSTEISCRLDGGTERTNTISGTIDIDKIGLCTNAHTPGTSTAWQGLLGEFIVFPSDISDTDRQRVEGYLANKWGLKGSLPGDHPYYSSSSSSSSTSSSSTSSSSLSSSSSSSSSTSSSSTSSSSSSTIPFVAKTVMFDFADNYGSTYLGLRAIDFWYGGKIDVVEEDFTAYTSSYHSTQVLPEFAFITALSKDWNAGDVSWHTANNEDTNQRLIVVFDSPITFNRIDICNYHHSGSETNRGVQNTKIYIHPTNAITDTVYGSSLSGTEKVFDGVVAEWTAGAPVETLVLSLSSSSSSSSSSL